MQDWDSQPLDAEALEQWSNTSAYFNGPAVLVELVAGPWTRGNKVSISRVLAGEADPGGATERRVCVATDERAPSTDARVGRLLFIQLPVPNCPNGLPCNNVNAGQCTGNLTDIPVAGDPNNRVLLTAGHCFPPGQAVSTIIQFEPIPNSIAATCGLQHPPAAQQYVVNQARVRSSNQDVGQDWAAFVCFPNPATGQTIRRAQGEGFALAAAGPAVGATIRKYGYGTQGRQETTDPFCICVANAPHAHLNGTQQTDTGPVNAVAGTAVCHAVHTCGGDSGSALLDEMNRIVAIHTAGACDPDTLSPPCPVDQAQPRNAGTVITHAGLQLAIQTVAGGAPVNDSCAAATPVAYGTWPFSTVGATTDGPPEMPAACGGDGQIRNDVWFTFRTPPRPNVDTRPTVRTKILTCALGANTGVETTFDTKLAVYPASAGCPPPVNSAAACDDDGCGVIGGPSRLIADLDWGTTYLIRVGGFGGQTGTGTLTIEDFQSDLCDVWAARFTRQGHFPFKTTEATSSGPDEPGCAFAVNNRVDNDLWFYFRAPTGDGARAYTCDASTTFDTRIVVYRVVVPPPPLPPCPVTRVACGDNECGTRSSVNWATTADEFYVIRVGGHNNAVGSGILSIGPRNDLCADARVVAAGSHTFDTRGASTDGPDLTGISCNGTIGADAWFRYTAPADGAVEVHTCSNDTAFDTRLAVYSGACNALVEVACDTSGSCAGRARLEFTASNASNPGRQYLIRVGGAPGGAGELPAQGAGTLTIRFVPDGTVAPINDECANASPALNGVNLFDVFLASDSAPTETACGAAAPANTIPSDVWFRYVATSTGDCVFRTCGSAFDTKIALYSACPAGNNTALACNDNSNACGMGSAQSSITHAVTAGNTYFIRIGGNWTPGNTDGTLTILPLSNDSCATPRVVMNGATAFNTLGATTDDPAQCMPMQRDVWFRYTATATGLTRFSLCGSAFDTVLDIYGTTDCAMLLSNLLACNDDNMVPAPRGCGANSRQSQIDLHTTAGTQYLLRVGGAFGATGSGTLTITPLANDNCPGVLVGNGSTSFGNVTATTDGPATGTGDCGGPGTISRDVWFFYFATGTGDTTFDICSATFDSMIAVYSTGSCANAALTASENCNNDACGMGGTRSRVTVPTVAGNPYIIRIGGKDGTQTGSGTLVITPPAPGPANNDCARALQAFVGPNPYDTTGATTDGATPGVALGDCGTVNNIINDVWFFFDAPTSGRLSASTCLNGQFGDTKIAAYNVGAASMCPPGPIIACSDNECTANRSEIHFDVTAGTRYLIRVGANHTANPSRGEGTLTLNLLSNDRCDSPRTVLAGATMFNSTAADTDGPVPGACFWLPDVTRDVWFRYRGTANHRARITTCGSSFDTIIEVYKGLACPPAPADLRGCSDDDPDVCGPASRQSAVLVNIRNGQDYLIRVGGHAGAGGPGVLNITNACLSDTDADGDVTIFDVFEYLRAWFAGDSSADLNENGMNDPTDLFEFLNAWFAGC